MNSQQYPTRSNGVSDLDFLDTRKINRLIRPCSKFYMAVREYGVDFLATAHRLTLLYMKIRVSTLYAPLAYFMGS